VSAAAFIVLLGGLALAILPLVPPAPVADPTPTEFSADRAVDHVSTLAREPRPTGSPENERGRDYIISRLAELDLVPDLQSLVVPDYYRTEAGDVTVTNVMARIPGDDSTGAVALVAHYDTVPATPGANDDAAGVATVLETARALLAEPPLRNDVILLFTDGEEPAPRYGSTAFVTGHPWANDVRFVLNLEALGSSGISILVETSGPSGWAAGRYAAAASHPTAYSYLTETMDLIGGAGTDFDPFKEAGVPGVSFAYVNGSPIYHTAADTTDTVSLRSLQHHGLNTLQTVREVGNLDLAQPPAGGDSVYFTVARFGVAGYPGSWAIPIAVFTGLGLAAAVIRRARTRRVEVRSVLGGAAVVFTITIVVALAATLAWQVIVWLWPDPGVGAAYLILMFLLIVLAGSVIALLQRLSTRLPTIDSAGGIVFVWFALALATATWLPGWSYLFAWPALGGTTVLLIQPRRTWLVAATLATLSWVTLVLVVPPVNVFFQMAQPRPGNLDSQITSVVVIAMVLSVLTTLLLASVGRSELERR